MKSLREELIDYATWREEFTLLKRRTPEELVDDYLKSINSETQIETPNVNNNEGKKEVCKYNKDGNCMFTEYCCNEYIGTCMV